MNARFSQDLSGSRWIVRSAGDDPRTPDRVRGRDIPATVPGCIHTDLLDAGLISDPAIGEHEPHIQWVSWTDWRYECVFEPDPKLFCHDRIDLGFECLDTVARIELNGTILGESASEFIPHRFEVRGLLRLGANRLAVTFTSPLRYIHDRAKEFGPRPVNGDWDPFIYLRKCASNFRWDWGPRVATCGITQPVRLVGWSGARLGQARVVYQANAAEVHVPIERPAHVQPPGKLAVVARLLDGEREIARDARDLSESADRAVLNLRPHEPPRRWTPDRSAQHRLYTLEITLSRFGTSNDRPDTAPATILDEQTVRVGWSAVKLETVHTRPSCDGCADTGSTFRFVQHGVPILCTGVNWIPEGLWPKDREKRYVAERLAQIRRLGVTMIRVWGGGRYEPDWFYDLCDELGIMVWQDFMFSCAMYPEEEPYRSLVEAEARHQVARLSRHPCVVLWCGGNECVWAHESWGFKERLAPGQTWGEGYYSGLLPRICADMDPGKPYWPNSPWSGTGVHPNDPSHGDRHTWEVRGDAYRSVVPSFCSEFGAQSPSNFTTLREAGLLPSNPAEIVPAALAARQLGPGGMARWIDEPIAESFRPPRDFDEWHYLAQLQHARQLRTAIEWMRANRGRCAGALVWQMNDAWPGFSWSLVDSGGRFKPAAHAVARANRPRLITIQPIDGTLTIIAVNETDDEWTCVFDVRRLTLDGRTLAESRGNSAAVPSRSVRALRDVKTSVGPVGDPRREMIVVDAPPDRATWYSLPDRELIYPRPHARVTVTPGRAAWDVEIEAETPLQDPWLGIERVVPTATLQGDMLGTLLPGERLRLSVIVHGGSSPSDPLPAADLVARPPVLWCANWFGADALMP